MPRHRKFIKFIQDSQITAQSVHCKSNIRYSVHLKYISKMKGQYTMMFAFVGASAFCDALTSNTRFCLSPTSKPLTGLESASAGWSASRLGATIMSDINEESPPRITISPLNEPLKEKVQLDSQLFGVSAEKPRNIMKKATPKHQTGPFSPLVLALKKLLGEEKLNKLRAKGISLHSDVINRFIETANTKFGQSTLVALFNLADRNGDGLLQQEEVASALASLGFTWLQQKQVLGILERADKDKNGVIDQKEFLEEAPKTLRTNLVKLAKKNGGELGFLV